MAAIFCTVYEVQMKAGKNVSVSGGDTNFITSFIDQAQQLINMQTRVDWIAKYATLDANRREVLKLAASNFAAMYAIQYDMSGYPSQAHAQTALDVLRDGATNAVKLLKEDQKHKDFVASA